MFRIILICLLIIHVTNAWGEIQSPANEYRRSIVDFEKHVVKQDFGFKKDILWQIKQIYLYKRMETLARELSLMRKNSSIVQNSKTSENIKFTIIFM